VRDVEPSSKSVPPPSRREGTRTDSFDTHRATPKTKVGNDQTEEALGEGEVAGEGTVDERVSHFGCQDQS
jgi:hypothetical protein